MNEFPAATHPLRALFYPRSVALVGASERSPWSSFIAHNLGVTGYQGQVFSVNREAKPAHGFPGFSSCRQIAETPDLAYLMVPAEVILEAFEDAAAAGIRNMVVLSSGFAEMSEEGASLQQRLVQRAAELGVRFLGPNSLGFANLSIQAPMTPVPTRLPLLPGKIALISQSGATNAEITEFAHQSGVGLSLYIATGNEAQIEVPYCTYGQFHRFSQDHMQAHSGEVFDIRFDSNLWIFTGKCCHRPLIELGELT